MIQNKNIRDLFLELIKILSVIDVLICIMNRYIKKILQWQHYANFRSQ